MNLLQIYSRKKGAEGHGWIFLQVRSIDSSSLTCQVAPNQTKGVFLAHLCWGTFKKKKKRVDASGSRFFQGKNTECSILQISGSCGFKDVFVHLSLATNRILGLQISWSWFTKNVCICACGRAACGTWTFFKNQDDVLRAIDERFWRHLHKRNS